MERRNLGTSGLAVTPIGLGLAGIGRPAYLGPGRDHELGADRSVEFLERRTHELLDTAYAAGVRYVDAARSYGLAERFLGTWLVARGRSPGDPAVGSKWGYTYVGDWSDWSSGAKLNEVKDHSVDALRRQYAESRAELGDHLGLYQIHSATWETGVLDDLAVLDELARLKEQGMAIGLTVSGPGQSDVIRQSLEMRMDGLRVFHTVQATWNLLERSAGAALDEAHQAGCGVIVKESLANGRLTRLGDSATGVLEKIAHDREVQVDTVAIAAVLANPWADVVLSGAIGADQLASNLDAVSLELSESEIETLAELTEPSAGYWSRRRAQSWS